MMQALHLVGVSKEAVLLAAKQQHLSLSLVEALDRV